MIRVKSCATQKGKIRWNRTLAAVSVVSSVLGFCQINPPRTRENCRCFRLPFGDMISPKPFVDFPCPNRAAFPKRSDIFKDFSIAVLLGISAIFAGCKVSENFPELGTNVAGPVDTSVSEDGTVFYVLNSDFDREYNAGSILLIDEDGNKLSAVSTPRLGRSLEVSGDRMLATFGDEESIIQYYDISTPTAPVLVKQWVIECPPLSTVHDETYDYFFVSCLGGDLWAGTFTEGLADGLYDKMRRIRRYGQTRRAMYLDTKRELLFAFVTDMARQTFEDTRQEDKYRWDTEGNSTEVFNEVPDTFEDSKKDRSVKSIPSRYIYQFVVLDVRQEVAEGLKEDVHALQDEKDPTADKELRWLYFTLLNADGTPDSGGAIRISTIRDYRTNFWMVRPNPFDEDSFFLSHRGFGGLGLANNILKVSIIGDLRPVDPATPETCESNFFYRGDQCVPMTADVLRFERVYGFRGEVDEFSFPGDFDIKLVNGQQLLIVNHFRDLVYWAPDNQKFLVTSKVLGQNSFSQIESTSFQKSYYELSMNQRGKALSCLYYGEAVMLLNVLPGEAIEEIKRID